MITRCGKGCGGWLPIGCGQKGAGLQQQTWCKCGPRLLRSASKIGLSYRYVDTLQNMCGTSNGSTQLALAATCTSCCSKQIFWPTFQSSRAVLFCFDSSARSKCAEQCQPSLEVCRRSGPTAQQQQQQRPMSLALAFAAEESRIQSDYV